MRMWIPLFVLLFSGLTFGQPSQDCPQDSAPCQYLFIIAPDEGTIQEFVAAVEAEDFALDDLAFGGALAELYKSLVGDLFDGAITSREGGGIAPLFVKRPEHEQGGTPYLFAELSDTGPGAFNGEEAIAKQPCSGFLAVFKDLDERRSHEEALWILQEVANRFPNVVFGPDPQTVIGPGAFEGPQATTEQDSMALGVSSASGDTGLSIQPDERVTIAVVDTGVTFKDNNERLTSSVAIPRFDFINADDPDDEYSHVNNLSSEFH